MTKPAAAINATLFISKPSPSAAASCRFGLPLRRGQLRQLSRITVSDPSHSIPAHVQGLLKWPDGSWRLAAVTIPTPRRAGHYPLQIRLNDPASARRLSPTPKPSSARPIPSAIVLLPPDYLCTTGAFDGPLLPAASTPASAPLDARVNADLHNTVWQKLARGSAPVDYERGLHEFFYYDLPHSAYMQFLRLGDPDLFRAAYAAARIYREKLVHHSGPMTGHPLVQPSNEWPQYQRLVWSDLRTMYIEGLLDDFHLTGDPRSYEVARHLADAYVAEIPLQGRHLRVNERNPGWSLLELCAFYDASRQEKYLQTAAFLVKDILAWQHESGAWLRIYEDLDECPHGCFGAQPFMHAVLMEGLIRYWHLTGDPQVRAAILKAADWLLTKSAGWRPEAGAWEYLPGCKTHRRIPRPRLSLMIAHGLAAAWQMTAQPRYRRAALISVAAAARTPPFTTGKLFCQYYRSSAYALAHLSMPPKTWKPQ